MKPPDYSNTILLPCPAATTFDAITCRIPDWWSLDFDGASAREGDEFTVRFGETFKTMRIESVAENTAVTWLCVDQRIVMPEGLKPLKNPAEWVGNLIRWTIARAGND